LVGVQHQHGAPNESSDETPTAGPRWHVDDNNNAVVGAIAEERE
jgi:hypothetical protein